MRSRLFLSWFPAVVLSATIEAQAPLDQAAELIRLRLEAAHSAASRQVRGDVMYSRVVLPLFYTSRAFRPGWFDARGLRPQALALLRAVRAADLEGLQPDDYHVDTIAELVDSIRARAGTGQPAIAARWADADLLLTDAFLIYASHLVSGRLDPVSKESVWGARGREVDILALLRVALDSNRVEETLAALLPRHQGYRRLRERLAELRAVERAGGWPTVPGGPALRFGDRHPRIAQLRARLRASGDFATGTAVAAVPADSFDTALDAAVRRFQRRHGLTADGVAGPGTLAELRVPVATRIAQIRVNMERWRWLPQSLGERHVLVNIAGFDMRVMNGNHVELAMPVVVGRPYRMTPFLSDRISYLVLSPTWTVPQRIALEDKLPLLRRNADELRRQGMRVFRASDMRELDPTTIDWARAGARNFPYVLRQDPGPQNAMGPVKFMFPNPFDVYLHGTPAQELFSRDARAFSSGCIRLERPLDLAELLLREQPAWTPDAIGRAARAGIPRTVPLTRPVPVHLLYWTVWAEEEGTIHVRPDVYGRDSRLIAAMAAPHPGPESRSGP